MLLDFLENVLPPDRGSIPNGFTIGMGELIKKARIEAGLSQTDLAKKTYYRQSTLSKIENGRIELSAGDLLYFAAALNKPVTYFFPKKYIRRLITDDIDDELIDELILLAKKLDDDDLKRIIVQVRALAQSDSL